MNKVDLTNQRFGLMIAICQTKIGKQGVYWKFLCDCGNTKERLAKQRNYLISCGCQAKKVHSERMKLLNKTHGMTGSPEWNSWVSMKDRCTNQNNPKFQHYGGRGITFCDRWSKFENFYADMGKRPDNMTLDRIDVNGNYEPLNCKWSTHLEQRHNRRDACIEVK